MKLVDSKCISKIFSKDKDLFIPLNIKEKIRFFFCSTLKVNIFKETEKIPKRLTKVL